MANGILFVPVLLLVLLNGYFPSSAFYTRQSALTLDLCDPLQGGKQISIDIVAQNDKSRKVTINGDGNQSNYRKNIPGPRLLQGSEYKFQPEQKTIKSVTVTSTANQICVNALVVDTTIVVDQPTDFMNTCPSSAPEDFERPCKQLRVSIDISRLFVCPEQLKDLLLKNKLVKIKPGSQTTAKNEPHTYDITDDMLQASAAIAFGVVEGAGTITAARQKYREARKSNPLQKLGTFAAVFETASTFISFIAPVFSVFSGIATIATTFLTPNPFDELAKYLNDEFKQINNRLTDIQADIADLGRLIEAKGGVLAMANQLSAIRYTIRNYGVLVDAISAKPVCGARELSQMPEVEQFMRQYQYDFVDNRLLDLYGVELGELVEATSLLTPYMMAYCRSKKHLVQKFAQELIYYGYAGLQSHFTYRSLLDATKGAKSGLNDEANNALMTKLYKFAKMAEVFREASLSEPGRALQLKLEDDILAQITKDEAGITDWLGKRIINPNDWPYECVVKDPDGQERKNSLVIQYRKINKIKSHWEGISSPEQLLTQEPWEIAVRTEYEIGSTYVRAPSEGKRLSQCKKPGTDNVMIVSYYPDPCCGEKKTVFVSWKKVAVCFRQSTQANQGGFVDCVLNKEENCEFHGTKEMLDSADRF